MNWLLTITGGLIIGGVALMIASWKMNKTASFDDGSFMWMILIGMLGGGMIVLGVVILLFAWLFSGSKI